MQDPTTGWAVWPSGKSWVILHTTDGWRDVENVTPAAVPTGGGLVLSVGAAGSAAVGVRPYERLLSSPLLTKVGPTTQWSPAELPGAVADARQAVGLSHDATTVVLQSGTVVTWTGSAWTTLTTVATVAPAGGLRLDTVTWADAGIGWLTGHDARGTSPSLQTADGGRTWAPVGPATAVAALAPCGAGESWLLPELDTHARITVERTDNGGRTWLPGASIAAPAGVPAWGCRGSDVWLLGHGDHLFASVDSGVTWSDRGKAPAQLTDLALSSAAAGFAASGNAQHPMLWAVTQGGTVFDRILLPAWVAGLGAAMSSS